MGIQLLSGILAQPTEHVYQPIWNINPTDIFGYEALIRFPNGFCNGNIELAFLLAREKQLLFELDSMSILSAVERYPEHLWVKECLLFVNIYPSTILHPKFEIFIENLKRMYPETKGRLVFEINETKLEAELWKNPLLLERTHFLKESGYYIALDDLGEEDADFEKVIWLTPDFIKLDRYFSIELASSFDKQTKISHYLDHANVHMTVVLEGIEKEIDLMAAKRLQVPFVQGYLLGRPEKLTAGAVSRGDR